MAERLLPKQKVAGSNPVSRSTSLPYLCGGVRAERTLRARWEGADAGNAKNHNGTADQASDRALRFTRATLTSNGKMVQHVSDPWDG